MKLEEKGFTLLELIITITLASVVLVIILGGLRLSINAWEAGEERIAVYQRMRGVLRQLSHEIESCFLFYYKKDKFTGKRYLAFEGRSDSFSIVSAAEGLEPDKKMRAGIREITYFLEDDKNNTRVLKRRERFIHPDTVFAKKDSLEVVVIKNVAWMKMKYYKVSISSIDGKKMSAVWSNTFSGVLQSEKDQGSSGIEKTFPGAIEIRLCLFENRGDEMEENLLPPLVIPIHAGKRITAEIS